MRNDTVRKNREVNRGQVLRKGLSLIRYLRDGRRTYQDIAEEFGVCKKTVRRMVRALEDAEIPVTFGSAEEKITAGAAQHVLWIDRRWSL